MESARSAFFTALIATSFGCTNAASTTLEIDDQAPLDSAKDGGDQPDARDVTDGGAAWFALRSSVFANGQDLDPKYTCDGENVSPPLSWDNVPPGTKSFALLLTDLDERVFGDAAPFVQWALFNIPQAFQSLPEGVGKGPSPSNVPGASQVRAWSALGGVVGGNHYFGPCPAERHRYEISVFALDVETLDGIDITKQPREVGDRLATLDNVLGIATLSATYARPE